jgi:hypothetical protein
MIIALLRGHVRHARDRIERLRIASRGDRNALVKSYWSEVDVMISRFVSDLKGAALPDAWSVTSDESSFLLGVTRSAALRLVRESRCDYLAAGLLCAIIESGSSDLRGSLIELTLLESSARIVGCNFLQSVANVQIEPNGYFRPTFQSFLASMPHAIASMGYVESIDRDGQFTYKQSW